MLPPIVDQKPESLAFHQRIESWLLGLGLGLVILGIGGGWTFINAHENRIYPGIKIDGIDVGGLSLEQAHQQVTSKHQSSLAEFLVILHVDDIEIASSSSELGLRHDTQHSITSSYEYARTGPWVRRIFQLIKLQFEPVEITTGLAFDSERLASFVGELPPLVNSDSTEPAANLGVSGLPTSLKINPGKIGRQVDVAATTRLLEPVPTLINGLPQIEIGAKVASIGAQLNDEEITAARDKASKLIKKNVAFKHDNLTLRLNDQELISLMAFPEGFNNETLQKTLTAWEKKVTREPQNAEFEYDKNTLKVVRFVPPQSGRQLDIIQTKQQIQASAEELLSQPEKTRIDKELVVVAKDPEITLANTNDLGIQERIGWGDSEYDHSIPSRIHNVSLTSNRISNTIVKPGEEFSFNKALGDVSAASGFQPAYVIKNGQTVLGDGGGVCQVSTTLFRAVLNAGLQITKRKAHSYRVSYYELNQKPGLDATVYTGDVDFRFINDTGHHILIHSEADSNDLYMKIELYGTSDGRTAEIVDHKTWDARPAPPSVYITDPSLPPGRVKQIDWATGGIKASFKHIVRDKNGKITSEKEYYSNYIPWSAKYLKGP